MQAQWLAALPTLPGETSAGRERLVHDEIWSLNGKPTIHQMARLANLVAERGAPAQTAVDYNADYQTRLAAMVNERASRIRVGSAKADDFMVTGVREFLASLAQRGVVLHLASGTELRFIREEAEWLGLKDYFGERFHGPAGPDDRVFSKRGVMDRILLDTGLPGTALVIFGDGHVEIEEARAVGAYAVAVCSDENDWRSRKLDAPKEARLTRAGAHFCVPDFAASEGWRSRLPWAA